MNYRKSKSLSSTTYLNLKDAINSKQTEVDLEECGYKIGKIIGKGAYSTVATSQFFNRQKKPLDLACKIINKETIPKDFQMNFFPRELEIIQQIDHPNVIQIHSIIQRGPIIFIFMRYAENGDLLEFIKKNGPINEHFAKIWFMQMVNAIKYLHSLNIAHRDLKCENILISKHMNIKLTDFGFARYCNDSDGNRILSKTYCGSAAYAAPEIVSATPYNPKFADIWSLGIILFIMLNGKMPFDDTNLNILLDYQKQKKIKFHSKILPILTKQSRMVVEKLLEPDITKRWTLEHILNCSWINKPSDD